MNIHRHFLGGVSAAFLAIWPVHAQAQSVTIAGPEILTEIFIPTTLEAFARDLGLNIRREVSGDGAFSLLLSDGSGQGANVRFDIRVAVLLSATHTPNTPNTLCWVCLVVGLCFERA